VARLLWAARAPLLAVAPGVILIGWTDQARDMVIANGLPSLHDSRIPLALAAWALVSWYWARICLLYTFVNPPLAAPTPGQQAWWEFWTSQIPRLLGAACIASVAKTFDAAAGIYEAAGDTAGTATFHTAFRFYLAATVAFYLLLAVRRRGIAALIARFTSQPGRVASALIPDRQPLGQIKDLNNPLSWLFLSLTFFLAPLASIAVVVWPIETSRAFGGAVPAVLLGLALIAPITSALVIVSARLRIPFFGIAAMLLVLAPGLWSDNHDLRTCRGVAGTEAARHCLADSDNRLFLGDAFQKWWDVNAALTAPIVANGETSIVAPPMVIVATAGGASRAAFWTSQVLGQIAGLEDNFADRLFMISGVSGGSLGAATFRSIVEADRRRVNQSDGHGSPRLPDAAVQSRRFIENDFLGPALATGLYVDLPARAFAFLFPTAWRPDDRAAALEKAWEGAWDESAISSGQFGWNDGFYSTFSGPRPWPILALNGTSVEMGKRIITSNVRFWSGEATSSHNLSGGVNRYDTFYMTQSDIPISTAVTMSARFPLVSPTGAVKDRSGKVWTRVTDGGLFENFGAATADEVLRYLVLRRADVQDGRQQTIPIAILISSDPSLDPIDLRRDGDLNRTTPDCAPTGNEPLPKPSVHIGNGAPECPVDVGRSAELIVDPARALYSGRVARGVAAATALLDRITEARASVRTRLLHAMATAEKTDAYSEALFDRLQARLGIDDHIDFFHFRQCRVEGSRGPTMSWHDSAEAWNVMQKMLGLVKNANGQYDDPCGNQVEFFRLCVRLARLSGTASDDHKATDACEAKGWPRPHDWQCDDTAHDGKRPYCRLASPRRG
jgi:hypothetical protein